MIQLKLMGIEEVPGCLKIGFLGGLIIWARDGLKTEFFYGIRDTSDGHGQMMISRSKLLTDIFHPF